MSEPSRRERLSGLQSKYLPEPLHGDRGLIISLVSLILVAILSIAVWEAVGGGDSSSGGGSADFSSGETIAVECEEVTETVVDESGVGDSGTFFPADPDDPSQAPAEETSIECDGDLPDGIENGEFDNCGNGVYAGAATSCGFSNQVAEEYRAAPGDEITADSQTSGPITLQCSEEAESAVACGHEDAVTIWILG